MEKELRESTGIELLSSALHPVAHCDLRGFFSLAPVVAVGGSLLLILAGENDGGGCWLAALLKWLCMPLVT